MDTGASQNLSKPPHEWAACVQALRRAFWSFAWALFNAGVVTTIPFSLAGQSTQVVPNSPSCATCAIAASRVVTLHGVPDSLGGLTDTYFMRRDSRGRYYVTSEYRSWALLVFDSTGQFLTVHGRQGSGPGEFRRIETFVFGKADTLHVFDRFNARHTVLDAKNNYVSASTVVPAITDAIVTDGVLIVNADIPTRASVGEALHFLSDSGAVSSFDQTGGLYDVSMRTSLRRILSSSDEGGFWAAHRTRYQIDLWRVLNAGTPRLVKVIKRSPDWFPPYDRATAISPGQAPQPFISGVASTDRHELWVASCVPSGNWERNLIVQETARGRTYSYKNADTMFDTVVDLVDTTTGDLISSRRFRQYFKGFLSRDLIWSYSEDADGVGKIQVWRLSIVDRKSQSKPFATPQ